MLGNMYMSKQQVAIPLDINNVEIVIYLWNGKDHDVHVVNSNWEQHQQISELNAKLREQRDIVEARKAGEKEERHNNNEGQNFWGGKWIRH